MKKLVLLLPLFALLWSCTPSGEGSSSTASNASAKLMTMKDSASYIQGMMMGQQINGMQVEGADPIINTAAWKAGLDQGISGGESIIPQAEFQGVMMKFQMMAQQASQAKAAAEKAKGATFLAENGTKDGVITTESGLQYKVITEGTGATPTAADQVEVNYEGRLLNGKVFDSSYDRGESITFGVTGVIAGWTEALLLMKEGAKYQLYIPAQLGYGERGSPPDIGPGATLIFDVELLKVNPDSK